MDGDDNIMSLPIVLDILLKWSVDNSMRKGDGIDHK